MIGRTIAHYRIVEPLGTGGMGTVYRAQHTTLASRVVALKVLSDAVASQPQLRERFLREAEIMAALHHENIVTLHDFLAVEGVYAIVMELVPGVTLDRWAGQAPVSFERAAPVFRQLLAALQHAHQHGVVHRDVKPSNVIVTPEGRVKVTDFGIARLAQSSDLTQTGMGMGTPRYMSPEQIQGKRDAVGPKSDIYSCGVLVHRVLAARPPFDTDDDGTHFAILQAHMTQAPPPLRKVVRDVPKEVEAAVLRALAKRPDDRWPTCAAFAHAMGLEDADAVARAAAAMPTLPGQPLGDDTVIPGVATPERKPGGRVATRPLAGAPPPETRLAFGAARPGWRRRLPWIAAGMLGLALLGGAALWLGGREPSTTAGSRPPDAAQPTATATAVAPGSEIASTPASPPTTSAAPAVPSSGMPGAATTTAAGATPGTEAATAAAAPTPPAATPPETASSARPAPVEPSPRDAALLRAEAQLDAGSPAAALGTLAPLLAADPHDAEALALRKRAQDARAEMERRDQQTRHREASERAAEARALLAKGKIDLALAAAVEALRIEPGNAEARRVRSAAEEEQRAAREAWASGAAGSPQIQPEEHR